MTLLFPSKSFRRPRERSSGLLFAFGVDDLSLGIVTGQTVTVRRNTEATVFDSSGRVATVIQDQPGWGAAYNAEAGIWEPGLRIGYDGYVNRCLQSENFGTTWTAVNTPTRTAAAWRCGDVVLDLLGDTSGATQASYTQNVALSGGNGKKGVAFFVRRGRTAPAGGFRFKVRDTTAAADRLSVLVSYSGTSLVPTVAVATGVLLETLALADGVYLIRVQTTTATVANTNQVQVIPCDVVAQTGDIHVGGVQVSDQPYPEQYRKTTTAATTTDGDLVTATIDWPPQDLTIYVRVAKPLWAYDPTTQAAGGLLEIGDQSTKSVSIQYSSGAAQIAATLRDNDGTAAVAAVAVPSTSQWEVAVQLRDIAIAPAVRIDAGGGFSAWTATAMDPYAAWSTTTLALGTAGSPGPGLPSIDAVLRRCLIAPGHVDLAVMRGIVV